MQILKTLKQGIACATLMATGLITLNAQTTATWIGPTSGGEWNTGANWSSLLAPGTGTNVLVGAGNNVAYNTPMSATDFGSLTNNGTLNISASGFNCGTIFMNALTTGVPQFFVTNGGAVNSTGILGLGTNAVASLASSASLTVSNLIIGYNTGNKDMHAYFTNNGGTFMALKTTLNNSSSSTLAPHLVINGGMNNLGTTTLNRSHASSPTALGSDGLAIYGGTVIITNLTLAGASVDQVYIAGGTVTNYGNVSIAASTAGRYMRVAQAGGLFVVSDPNIIYMNTVTAGSETARYQVTGGTNFIGGIYMGASNSTAAATATVTVGGTVYVGSQGIATNGAVISTVTLNNGGVLGATADWLDTVNMNLSGASSVFTFQTADPNNTSHNITVDGILSGGGPAAFINKTGGGTLTLDAANTYTGTTLIQTGTLVLGANASLASTPILVGSGAFFNVSSVSGGYSIPASKVLSGLGTVTGSLTVSGSAITDPGSNTLNGTLTFSGDVTETGGATNHFDLISTPGAGNDKMVISGNFNASGANYIDISGGKNGNVYALIQYGGTFNGDVTLNFTVTGAPGILSNDVATSTIYLISQNTARTPTNIVWVGNSTVNDWDLLVTTNWVLNGALDHFMNADTVLFDDTGIANSNVNLTAAVVPASVTVNSSGAYNISGSGYISGSGSLTKSGNGSLSISTANDYTGSTTINGGELEVGSLANGGVASPIGASVSDPSTLIITNGALKYTGNSVTVDRAATLGGSAVVNVTNGATTLTINGSLTGTGSLTKTGNGSLTLGGGNSYPGGVALNTGTLTLNNATAAGSGPITFYGNSTLALGAVTIGNVIVLTNHDGLITGGNAGGATGINGVTGSSNLLLGVTTGVFDLKGNMANFSGTITFSNAGGGTIRLNGSIGSPLAVWDLGAGPMDLNVRSGSTSNNIGALRGSSGTTLSGRGGSSNNGGTTFYIGANGLSTTFDGVIQDGSGGSSSTTAINKVGSGILTLSGANTYSGTTTVSTGTLALIGLASIGSSTINVVSGATLDVSALTTPTLSLTANQLLQGRGVIQGSVDSTSGAKISPGGGLNGSIGTLTVTNNINLGGTTWMKLTRGASPNSDRLVSSLSSITYGGTLVVTNVGPALQVGDTFTLFSGSGLNGGTFATTILPNYYTWDTSNLGVNGTIQVATVLPPPSLTNVDYSTLSSGTITLNAINGAANGPVIVQTSTNLLSNWTSISTNTFDGSGNFTLPITVDPAAPQSYFRLLAY